MARPELVAILAEDSACGRTLGLAVSRGLLTIQALGELEHDLVEDSDDPARDLLEAAVNSGLLQREAVDLLISEAAKRRPVSEHTPVTAIPTPPAGGMPGALLDSLDVFPAANWERYELMEFIGRGGMGDVFKARDPRLNRYVAIKFLRRDDPHVLTRFKREAQVQARIDHDNVCPVYEVGEVEGLHYIAMQYVSGGSLKEISDLVTMRDKAAIMVDVADALGAAHRVGLVHRDVKPANIMVDRHHDGSWRPFVVDFGIARDVESADLTASGAMLGTPSFAAPEQVRGDTRAISPRTDIYSLGATLYWFLTEHAPFEGSYPEILNGVTKEDPQPPHRYNSDIPVDLETIVLKCLEKEPDRRYTTAREVSEDLRRFLEGEPIAARRASLTYRLGKNLMKHRTATAAGATALAIIIALAGAYLRSSLRSAKLTTLAQTFAGEVEEVEGLVRREAMMPLHDTSHLRAVINQRMDSIRTEMERLSDLAVGPGNYALGSGYLATGDYETAVDHLERAWQKGYREASVAYALGLSLGRLYQEQREEAAAIGDEAARASFERVMASELRDPALEYLRQAEGVGGVAPDYVTGLIAFYEKDFEAALARATAAAEKEPWLYEAHKLRGDVLVATAQGAAGRGEVDEALADFELAGAAYALASNIARSDAGVYEADCIRQRWVMDTSFRVGRPAASAFAEAVTACSRGIEADSGRARTRAQLSGVYWLWADHERDVGGDPFDLLEKAREAADSAIELDSESFIAHYNLGVTRRVQGLEVGAKGDDPRTLFDQAVVSLERAVELRPSFVHGHDELGYAFERKARAEQGMGLDPGVSLERAIAAFNRAIELDEGYANAHNNLGIAWWRRGAYERRSGLDGRPSLDRAAAAYERALAINPSYANALLNRGLTYRTLALIELEDGLDPIETVAKARSDLSRGLDINPEPYWARLELAAAEVVEARWRMQNGQSPEDQLRAAAHAIEAAMSVNPRAASVHQNAASIHRWRAEWQASSGRVVHFEVREGRRRVERALELNPRHAKSLVTRAALLLLQADAETRTATRRALANEARTAMDQALAINVLLAGEVEPLRERAATLVAGPAGR